MESSSIDAETCHVLSEIGLNLEDLQCFKSKEDQALGLKKSIFCKNESSVLLNCVCHNEIKQYGCDYCHNIRGSKEKVPSYMTGFTSGKFRADDFEQLLDLGFARTGNYFYQRDTARTCCDVFQYRVDIQKYTPCPKKKKVMRKFYRYLMQGEEQSQ